MKITEDIDVKIGLCDIETLKELFDVGIYNPDTGEWQEFEVSAYRNDLYHFVKCYTSKEYDYLVTFNGINFDQQVLQYIVDNYEKWYDKTNLEVCQIIYEYAQKVIEDSNYDLFHTYKEKDFSIYPIDIFRIHHFDNENRMTSLKWCAFMLNEDVEEMPIHHSKENLTKEEIEIIRAYRRNDVRVTEKLFQLTLGNVDIPELKDYKGKNKIQDRFDVMKETGLQCLNWSDVKIGEEWNKLDYIKEENISDPRDLFPKKVKHPFGQKFKNYFPKHVEFETDQLKEFVKKLGNEYVKNIKQEFPIKIGNTTYTVAKGGLHSTEKHRHITVPEGFRYDDEDIGLNCGPSKTL